MNALVVPSNREKSVKKFLDHWNFDLDIFIVQDGPTKTFKLPDSINHYSWTEINETLGENAWIISRKDSAIRSFGFLMAYRAEAEYICSLDDDTRNIHFVNRFIDDHQHALNGHSRWTESYLGQRTRGIPYRNQGNLSKVMLNVGLWEGHPDLDAVQTLAGVKWKHESHATRLIPYGQYFPMCAMNLCFHRELTPLMYFPLMGEGYPYGRFDDIWCGIIVKKICDHLGWSVACGPPYVNHEKASDPLVNLVVEAPGIAANEFFWEIIDTVQLTSSTPTECMVEIGEALQRLDDQYLVKLGLAISVWTRLFD